MITVLSDSSLGYLLRAQIEVQCEMVQWRGRTVTKCVCVPAKSTPLLC